VVVQEVAEEVVVVTAVCGACNLDMMEEVGRDHLRRRRGGREAKRGSKLRGMSAWVDPFL